MNFEGISNEAVSIFDLMKEFNSTTFYTIDLFFVIILDENHRNTIAYKVLSGTMLSEDLESITYDFTQRHFGSQITKQSPDISTLYEPLLKRVRKKCETIITSGDIMIEIISSNDEIKNIFKSYGVSIKQLENALLSEKKENDVINKDGQTIDSKKEKQQTLKQKKTKTPAGEAEKNLINLSEMAENGNIDQAYGNDEIISTIFTILSKRKYNNVVLVGEPGIGKTTTVKHIANVISNGMCPNAFNNKTLLLVDFSKLIIGTMYKGLFETKFQSIVDDASKSGKYIFFIDDIDNILNPGTKVSEMPTNALLDLVLSNKNIPFICTTTKECYSKYIMPDKVLSKSMTKIELNEKNETELFTTIKNIISVYENFHNVSYTDKAILTSISLAKKYIKGKALPESSIDLLDEAGAMVSLMVPVNPDIEEMKSKLASIRSEILTIENSSNRVEYDKIDELTRRELTLSSELTRLERDEIENQEPIEVNEEHIVNTLSKKVGASPKTTTNGEREILSCLEQNLKNVIIGQDEAVEVITKAVKRKIIGVSSQEKPIVLMMVGKTGTGKTLLAKTLANELFGSNEFLVRIDMSEYSDKMSVNKFTGCFTPDMGVLMSNGEYKEIKDVIVGDSVITPEGNIKKVTNVWTKHYSGELDCYKNANTTFITKCTKNHEILVREGVYYKNGRLNKSKTFSSENVGFKQSYEINVGDFSTYPKEIHVDSPKIVYDLSKYIVNNPQYTFDDTKIWNNVQKKFILNRFINFDEKLARIFGYYVSEGGCGKLDKDTRFTFNSNETTYVDELVKLLHDVFGDFNIRVKYNEKRKRCDVAFNNKCICYFLKDMCGRIVYEKHIPKDILMCNKNTQINFLETAFFGDGTKTARNATRYTTVSSKLAEGIHTLLRNNHIFSQLNKRMTLTKDKKNRSTTYYVYVTGNSVDVFNRTMPTLKINRSTPKNKEIIRFGHMDEKYFYSKITEKTNEYYNGIVYDLTIDGDSSYVVNGMSVHNSAPGYVGYEEGGILTEAIKNKSRCVLLLDEIEKANDEIFNLLLQVFDEGRLTDNKGVLVNFKDVIIIMTSNVGAKEVSEATGRIGFSNSEMTKNDDEIKTKTIIKNAMKHKFPPEFLNRIDKIVWFNDLTDDDLIEIIINEIKKVSDRIEKIGYHFSQELFGGKLVKNIFDTIVNKREYGARPILREIEEQLEDKIADLIISENVEIGHVFTEGDICF